MRLDDDLRLYDAPALWGPHAPERQTPGGRAIEAIRALVAQNGIRAALRVQEAAQRLGIPLARVRDLCRRGKIAASRDGKSWLIRPEAIEQYLTVHEFDPARHPYFKTHEPDAGRSPLPRLSALPDRGRRGRKRLEKTA